METRRGVIQKGSIQGRHGPYSVVHVEGLDSVTFSTECPVWKELTQPQPGEIVILSMLRKKRAGWRAMQVRYAQPSDFVSADGIQKKDQGEIK